MILDGWGCAPPGPGNAVELAATPNFDRLWRTYPHTTLEASGESVGLPPGQMGNSEVGHLTIGSGRVLFQDLMRVNKAIEDGSFFENAALKNAFARGDRRARTLGPEPVEGGRLGELDRVARSGRRAAPAVEDDERYERIRAAVAQIAPKNSGLSEAPPTSAPPTSGWRRSSSAFSGLTEPP